MKKSEIEAMTNDKLVAAFYWSAVRTTNEANSRRGLTKASEKIEGWIIAEMAKRFNLDVEKLQKEINP